MTEPSTAFATDSRRGRYVGLAVVAAILYLSSIDLAPNGDAVYYANIVETRSFDQLTLHQGYYLLGAAFAGIGGVFGASTLLSLAVMNALIGAAMLVVARALFRHLGLTSTEAWIGVLTLFVCHRVFVNATTVECYALQTLCLWATYLAFLTRRFNLAGGLLAVSVWVAPLSAAFALGLGVIAWKRAWGLRPVLRVGLIAMAAYAPFFVFFHEELLYGIRGLLAYDSHREAQPGVAAVNFVRFQIKHYGLLCVLFLPAVFALRRHVELGLITLALLLPNLYVMSKLVSEDHVFFMPLDLIFAAWIVVGVRVLRRRRLAWLAGALVVAQLVVFVKVESSFLRPRHLDVAATVRSIGATIDAADDPIVFGAWSERMLYVYFNRSTPSYPLEAGPLYDRTVHVGDVATLDVADREIFVLDRYRASGFAELVRSEASLAARERALSTRTPVERAYDVNCEVIVDGALRLYRCR